MKNERRSHYRVLHVQPEAPAEIIVAAYRCLMTKLRHHPDLGGDHETAVRINEAYAVLSNPTKRRAYDQLRRQKRPAAGTATPQASQTYAQPPSNATPERACPLCGHGIPRVIAIDTRCSRCDSPLAPIAHNIGGQREAAGRRGAARVDKNEAAMIYPAYGRRPSTARLRDLSPSGISLFTGATVTVGATVRVVAPSVDLVAHVVQVRVRDRIQLVHACLLTARFTGQPGVFVSVCA